MMNRPAIVIASLFSVTSMACGGEVLTVATNKGNSGTSTAFDATSPSDGVSHGNPSSGGMGSTDNVGNRSSGAGESGGSEGGSEAETEGGVSAFAPTDSGAHGPLPPLDAALASLDAAPSGQAGFAFIVNNVVQQPMTCPGTLWQFDTAPGVSAVACGYSCSGTGGWGPVAISPCSGIESVLLVNIGALDMAYIAGPCWNVPGHTAYVPGGYPGGDFVTGVLAPGANVDITSVYNGGITALVGSAEPFSSPEAGYASDEGQIPWPTGVQGSGGATTMYVAEIETRPSCQAVTTVW